MKHRIAILALAGAAALCATAAANAGDSTSPGDFPYRMNAVVVGSMIPKDVVRAQLPIDARYADLTAGQRATMAADYKNMPDGDEPPYPVDGLRPVAKASARFGYTFNPVGQLVVGVMVDAQGQPGDISVYKSPDPELTRLVASVLSQQSYKPAVCSGQPCARPWVLRLDFPRRAGVDAQVTGMISSEMKPIDLGFH